MIESEPKLTLGGAWEFMHDFVLRSRAAVAEVNFSEVDLVLAIASIIIVLTLAYSIYARSLRPTPTAIIAASGAAFGLPYAGVATGIYASLYLSWLTARSKVKRTIKSYGRYFAIGLVSSLVAGTLWVSYRKLRKKEPDEAFVLEALPVLARMPSIHSTVLLSLAALGLITQRLRKFACDGGWDHENCTGTRRPQVNSRVCALTSEQVCHVQPGSPANNLTAPRPFVDTSFLQPALVVLGKFIPALADPFNNNEMRMAKNVSSWIAGVAAAMPIFEQAMTLPNLVVYFQDAAPRILRSAREHPVFKPSLYFGSGIIAGALVVLITAGHWSDARGSFVEEGVNRGVKRARRIARARYSKGKVYFHYFDDYGAEDPEEHEIDYDDASPQCFSHFSDDDWKQYRRDAEFKHGHRGKHGPDGYMYEARLRPEVFVSNEKVMRGTALVYKDGQPVSQATVIGSKVIFPGHAEGTHLVVSNEDGETRRAIRDAVLVAKDVLCAPKPDGFGTGAKTAKSFDIGERVVVPIYNYETGEWGQESGAITGTYGDHVYSHDANTTAGSCGAAILSKKTGLVLGIHIGHDPVSKQNLFRLIDSDMISALKTFPQTPEN